MRIMANFYGATRLEQSFTEGALIILIAECVSARLWIKDLFPQSMYIHTYIRSIWCFWKLYYTHTLAPITEECGIVAQVSSPLAQAEISMYYICTYCNDHTLVSQWVSVSNFCGRVQVVIDQPINLQRRGREWDTGIACSVTVQRRGWE